MGVNRIEGLEGLREQLSIQRRGFRRGKESEERTARALELLKERGMIVYFQRTPSWGTLDKMGIDFLIKVAGRAKIPMQVKSSNAGRSEHVSRRSNVACLVVHDLLTTEELVHQIYKYIILGCPVPIRPRYAKFEKCS